MYNIIRFVTLILSSLFIIANIYESVCWNFIELAKVKIGKESLLFYFDARKK